MLPNLELLNIEKTLNAMLSNLSQVLYNSNLLLYKNIPQNKYVNLQYAKATVNYNYVPSYFRFIDFISFSQIGVIIQNYVNQCNSVIDYINSNNLANSTQDQLNTIEQSIAQLNNFATALYNNEQSTIYTYIVPYNMSLRMALFLNNISFNYLNLILFYNMATIQTVQLIPQNTNLILLQIQNGRF